MNWELEQSDYKSAACVEHEALLEDHLNGELVGPDAAKLAEHLKSCAGCTAALADAESSTQLLSAGEPTADPGPGFARVVMARIRNEMDSREDKSIWRPFVSLAWKLSATAALALVLLVTFDVKQHSVEVRDQNEMAIMTSNDTPELLSDEARLPANRDEMLILMAETNDHAKH
jgi:predicted anti-sigma-YlaC factor YlaD